MNVPIVIEPQGQTTSIDACVIWLHGLGANGQDFVPAIPLLGISKEHPIRFVFPTATTIPVTINAGYVMPAWYDIVSVSKTQRQVDEQGISASVARIHALIQEHIDRGISPSRIILAGFSQGAAIAYMAGFCKAQPLGGVVALSGYLPSLALFERVTQPVNQNTPVWIAHGHYDDVVDVELGAQAFDYLQLNGYKVQWQTYPIDHTVSPNELREMGHFIAKVLAQ